MSDTTPSLRFMLSKVQHVVSLSAGAGLSPTMPGTVGAVVGYPLHFALQPFGAMWESLVLALLFVLGVWTCQVTGSDLKEPDHGSIVWDETWGMAMVLAWTPAGIVWWIAAFFLFRAFDILKPWPVNLPNNHMHNGFGVMFDDGLAAAYAIAVLQGVNWLLF